MNRVAEAVAGSVALALSVLSLASSHPRLACGRTRVARRVAARCQDRSFRGFSADAQHTYFVNTTAKPGV